MPADFAPCDLGERRDSRAIAMAIAPASTASPASWPPMRRGSSGSVAEVASALMRCGRRPFTAVPAEFGLALAAGDTVGNRLVGFCGEVPVPGKIATLPGTAGRAGVTGTTGGGVELDCPDDEGAAAIAMVAAAWKEDA